jgi:hypothetical protein
MQTFKELAELYCETQEQTPEGLREILDAQTLRYHPHGFMLLRCEMLDSSLLGTRTILPYGPNNTFKEPPAHPVSPRGLASDMSVVEGAWVTAHGWAAVDLADAERKERDLSETHPDEI